MGVKNYSFKNLPSMINIPITYGERRVGRVK
jgi:hypothetical protein